MLRRPLGALRHPLALVLLFAVGLVAHREEVAWLEPGADETAYLRTFDLVDAGRDPYDEPQFMYTPPFALAGAAARRALGERSLLLALSLVNLAGLAALAWAAVAGSAWWWRQRLLLAAVVVAFSPLAADGMRTGSISLLFLGAAVGGLVLAWRRPLPGGALLGAVNALKPLTVPAFGVLAAQAARRRGRGWQWPALVAGCLAGALVLLPGVRYLPGLLTRTGGLPDVGSNISFSRASYALGVEIPALPLFVLLAGLAAALAWARPLGPRATVVLATSATILAMPINNPSTMLLSLPAQAAALEAAWRHRLLDVRPWHGWARLGVVAAAVVSIHGSEGVVAAGGLPSWQQGLVTLVPLLDVAGLTAYALWREPAAGRL